MKAIIISSLLFFSAITFAQDRCPDFLNALDNDEPPGCSICFSTFQGKTGGYTPDSFNYDFPCGEIEGSQWFSLYASLEGKLEILLTSEKCQNQMGIEAAIYDENFNRVSNCGVTDNAAADLTLVAENLDLGVPYFLMIDGVENDDCEFSILTIEHFSTNLLFLEPFTLDNEPRYCIDEEFCLTFPPVLGAISYDWNIDQGFEILSGGGEQDTFVCCRINGLFGQLNVSPFHPCAFGSIQSLNLANDQFFDIHMDTILCVGECIEYWDTCFTEDGMHEIIFENPTGCDSALFLTITHNEIFPSPKINCQSRNDSIFIDWNAHNGVTEYDVFIDREFFTTTIENKIFLSDVPIGELVNVKVQPKGSCSYLPAEAVCNSIITKASDDFFSNKINVFPNPTTGNLNIETDLKIQEIEIYNASGRILQKEKTTSFELKNRSAGIYFIKIKTSDGVGVKRIFVN